MAISVPRGGRLGRGLAALIGEPKDRADALPPEGEQRLLALSQIQSGSLNPRKNFRDDELEELANSIRTKGLVQPIVVRPLAGGAGFEIVAGERRWRAAQRAGLHQVPCIVRELSDKEVLELAIIENVQRADLNAIEEASGYRDLIERYGYTQEELSEIIGKSRSHVANTLRLLKLPLRVQALVQEGKLSAGHARTLIGREDAEALAERILEGAMNVRQAEEMTQAQQQQQTPDSPLTAAAPAIVTAVVAPAGGDGGQAVAVGVGRTLQEKDADTIAFEKELSDALGLKVEIKRGSGESGSLIVRYGNFDQLDYIRQRLTGG